MFARETKAFSCLCCILALPVITLAGCGWCHWGWLVDGGGTGTSDATAPKVSFTDPADGATGVAINTRITATFSEAMDTSTITAATFTATGPDEHAVAGTRAFDVVDNLVMFEPTSNLTPGTEFVFTITTAVEDLAGNALANDFVWTFTTAPSSPVTDTLVPTVSSTTPVNAATGVAINTRITATFSEAMDPSTITPDTFAVTGPGTSPVSGTVDYDAPSRIATFTPDIDLTPSVAYSATITTDVKDLKSNALANDFVWSFATGVTPDTTAPTVSFTIPANGATGVVINTKITATFSEAMDPSTITAAAFTVDGPGAVPISGNVTYAAVGNTATFTPADNLTLNRVYTATITTAVRDLAGNALAVNHVWTFATPVTAPDTSPITITDTVAPTVSSTSPVHTSTGVPINRQIYATFSEAMDPLTISTANYTVTGPGATSITGTVSYDVPSHIATFVPTIDLPPNALFTVRITTGVNDLAGNELASDFVWTFTTGASPDTSAPTVRSTAPVDAATGVAINATITATFSEAMDPTMVTVAQFTLTGPGATPATGTVAYHVPSKTAVFTPTNDLAASTTFIATITTGVKDLSGNALASNFVWSFTTGVAADTTAPTVISTNPADTATGVPINKTINATFSEAMDPLTISTANYTVTGPGATSITGTVSYDVPSHIATFVPTIDLPPNALFTVRITTGVNDLAGNALASNFVWSFTTGTTLVEEPVNLRSLSTFAAIAGAGLTNSNSGGQTTINGDVGLSPTGTCLGDGSPCSATNPLINGTLYANDPGGVAAAAKADLTLAYDDAFGRPPGTTVNDLSGMVLAPGVYTSGSTMSIAVGGTLTLDALGDANAVWIFQIGSSLTVNNSAEVILINGAKASNVYWAIFASSTMGTLVSFKGNVLAGESNSLGTGSTVEGRMLCRVGQITLLSNTITTPAQ